ncbi:tyrosine--tRNA ligase [Candidatus Dojkabacteria bacterium]|jgi:tyrosyl-tRNA synthetase|nr:tyrosine--tRNA ligase [Candidatus Dojkabacteria bacterium]
MENTKEQIIERILNKAVEEIIPGKEELKALLLSGKKLRLYQGFDPTAPTLHIGHTVMMRKLEDFRKLGHEVIFLMGNFTGMIGDPTDKGASRQQLTIEQANENLKAYKEQASSLIDMDNKENPVKVMYNYDWLSKLTFKEIIGLASEFTVQQMIKRSMFQKRLQADKPIGLHEFLYPLMQGYDSVAMDVDIEVGGNDQLFNMLAGRTLMRSLINKEKFVIAGKLLTTTEGTKMGKSEGNMIMLSDTPENIFGKVMGFADEQIAEGFELLTDLEMSEVEGVKKELEKGINPMELKKKLAFEVTKCLKGADKAVAAQKHFENIFQKKDFNTKLDEVTLSQEEMPIVNILVQTKLTSSKGSARRLIEQGAVYINEKKVDDWTVIVHTKDVVLKAGKKVIRLV